MGRRGDLIDRRRAAVEAVGVCFVGASVNTEPQDVRPSWSNSTATRQAPSGSSSESEEEPSLVDGRLFVGDSEAARQVRRMISRVSRTSVTTLIHGETGTGKEIVALLLHRNSPRSDGPLVAVNCAAIPDAMLEGELFGYEKGAFTGAVRSYPGKFGLADGGTLFLDEIGELSLGAQAKILRAIESREIFRLGSVRPRRCRVRIVAATNRDLGAEVTAGRFRADLYYRLAVVRLTIPPLTERRSDIAALAEQLLRDVAAELGCPGPSIDADALAELERRSWPGNVRELRNTLEHALVIARDPRRVRLSDLPRALDRAAPPAGPGPARAELDGDALLSAIRACGGKAGAARRLNVSRTTLYRRLQRLGLDPATV
jgi:DNA-binding NtrC family response regulator